MLLIAHLVLSVGLALMFTPLFTVSLGALPPNLYSHGSAMIGATQQVAGAAGTALFVAVMTLQTAKLAAGGADPTAALTPGYPRRIPLRRDHLAGRRALQLSSSGSRRRPGPEWPTATSELRPLKVF